MNRVNFVRTKRFLKVYEIFYSADAEKFLSKLPLKHRAHVKDKVEECLTNRPKCYSKHCNIKEIAGSKPQKYRFHISMTYTLIYRVDDLENRVIVGMAMGINQAHSKYGIV